MQYHAKRPPAATGGLLHGDGTKPESSIPHITADDIYGLLDGLIEAELEEAVESGITVYIVDDSRDADTLRRHGIMAITWHATYRDVLRGGRVVILSTDGEEIATSLIGVTRSCKIVDLLGGVTDWLEAGNTVKELEAIVGRTKPTHGRSPDLVRLDSVEAEKVDFLWEPYIPSGKLTLVYGAPGLGKTHVALALAAIITHGDPLPGDDGVPKERREPGNVIILSAEDGVADTLVPRLQAAGADMARVYVLRGSESEPDAGMSLSADMDLLDDAAEQVKPALIIIDPIQGYIGGVDMHRANEIRPILSNLARLAERHNCAVLAIGHLTKGGAERAIYRGLGSIDFVAAARSMLLLDEDPNDEKRRILAHAKSNLAPLGKSLQFRLVDGRVEWCGISELTAEDLNAPRDRSSEERGSREEAIDWLREALADGPRPGKELIEQAEAELGISEKTLRRAKAAIGAGHYKTTGQGGQWVWYLPKDTVGQLCPTSPNLHGEGVTGKLDNLANQEYGEISATKEHEPPW